MNPDRVRSRRPVLSSRDARATTRRRPCALVLAILFASSCASSEPPASAGRTTARSRYETARTAARAGDAETAGREVRLALQDDPRDAQSHFLLGCLLARRGEHDRAIVGFERTLALDPSNADALYNLGTLLLRRGEVLAAARLLEEAVSIRPAHVPSRNNLAKAYCLAGLPELAVASYEEALRQDPADAIALANLVRLAEAAGEHDAAEGWRRRLDALGRDPSGAPSAAAVDERTLRGAMPVGALQFPQTAAAAPPTPSRDDPEAAALLELLRDVPHVTVERRGGRLALAGWTRGAKEKELIGRMLAGRTDVLDLTSDDAGDPQRMIEIDAVIFIVTGLKSDTVGFNFLRLIDLNFNYYATDSGRVGTGFTAPGAIGAVNGLQQESWMFSAAADYSVEIANESALKVAVLARPHLTALSGTHSTFLAGGELVFKVSGINSGDIKPYPFGTTLTVTPTLLRTPADDGAPRIHVAVEAGRTSVLALLDADPDQPTAFEKFTVSSQAVLGLGQTLILGGLSQRETRVEHSGVPVLMSIPILGHLFSTQKTVEGNSAVVILLTPRDAAFWGAASRRALEEFVARRREFVEATKGTDEDRRRFVERHPDWDRMPPNRFGSHAFLLENSQIYRAIFRNENGDELDSSELDLGLLDKSPK